MPQISGCADPANTGVSGMRPTVSMPSRSGDLHPLPSYSQADLDRELATAPVLPGAMDTSGSSDPALNDTAPAGLPVDMNRWWTAPGSVQAALTYLKTHPPTGAELDGTGTSSGGTSAPLYSIIYGHAGQPPLPFLEIDVVAHGGGVAVRATIQVSDVSSGGGSNGGNEVQTQPTS